MINHRLKSNIRQGFAWLELILVLAFIGLLIQMFPSFRDWLWLALQKSMWCLNIQNWSRSAWRTFNIFAVLFLLGVRYVPDAMLSLKEDWLVRQRKTRHLMSKAKKATAVDQDNKARLKAAEDWRKRAEKRLPFR